MITLNNSIYTSFVLVLSFLLSGCLETMQSLGAKPSTNQNAVAQQKPVLPSEPAATSTAKVSRLETQPKPGASQDAVRVSAQGQDALVMNRLNPVSTTKKTSLVSFSKGKEISCTPNVVRPGDTLVIKTNKAYPDFGVRVPDKNVKFILLVAGGYPEGLMDSDKFAKQSGIEINVSEAKVKPDTRVFTKEGVYGFVVSSNLETDDGTPSFECKVRYAKK